MHFPVQLAKDVKPRPYYEQKDLKKYKFSQCPGMFDYSTLGYIIPAWTDIHIMANKAGSVASMGSKDRGNRGFKIERMDESFIQGAFKPIDDIPTSVFKFESPWKIFSSRDVSVMLMPAIYHSDFLDDLFIWPGVVDYNKFHTSNLILSPKRTCKVHIKAGEPLLHAIPIHNKYISAGYGPGNDFQVDCTKNEIPGDNKQYYRKFLRINKDFQLSKLFGSK
jgi:hypothetical protein